MKKSWKTYLLFSINAGKKIAVIVGSKFIKDEVKNEIINTLNE